MIECKQIQVMLPALLEGVLSPDEERLANEHLAMCQHCGAALEDLKKAANLIQGLEEVEPPPWFTQKVMSRIREEAEQKKSGIFGRLFYPLHVKVPIQALASLLIVVLALYVYRSVEPETEVVQTPSEVARQDITVPKHEAEQEYDKAGAGSPTPENKALSKGPREKASGTIAAVPRPEGAEIGDREEAPPPVGLAADSTKAENQEAVAGKQAQEMRAAVPSTIQREAPQMQKAAPLKLTQREQESMVSAGAQSRMKEAPDSMGPQSPRQTQAFAAKKAEPIGFTLHANDVEATTDKTIKLLGQLDAHSIVIESRDGVQVITGELAVQKVEELFKKLSPLGRMEEKSPHPVITEGTVSVRIEVTGKP
ncbi:MAG TPA: zf-HC2 domain-containing protein [Syntrophorhabdales bacterium]|nr:zf-HC2 domain-containing protein [Syntrophorhabdales bacterium]